MKGQTRSSGEPYIIHPVAVSRILAEMRLDIETLQAALLHGRHRKDCDVTKEDLEEKFGNTVAELVDGVSKLDKLNFVIAKKRKQRTSVRWFSPWCKTSALSWSN